MDYLPFLTSQLTRLRKTILPPTQSLYYATGATLPRTTEPDSPGTAFAVTPYVTPVGGAVVISTNTTQVPPVSVLVETRYTTYEQIAAKFELSYHELDQAMEAGTNLQAIKAGTAVTSNLQKLDASLFSGSRNSNLQGMWTHPNAGTISLPADGNENGGVNSPRFIHKTPDQIIRDLNLLKNSIPQATNAIYRTDVVEIDLTAYLYISTLPYQAPLASVVTGKTTLEVFMENQSKDIFGVKAVIPSTYLSNITDLGSPNGVAGGAMAYVRDSTMLCSLVSQDPTFNPPKPEDLGFSVTVVTKTAGANLKLPQLLQKCVAC